MPDAIYELLRDLDEGALNRIVQASFDDAGLDIDKDPRERGINMPNLPRSPVEELNRKAEIFVLDHPDIPKKKGRRDVFFFDKLEDEFHLFLCSNSQRYVKLKRDLAQQGGKSQTVVVSAISAAVAAQLGAAIGAVVPLIAICLITLLKLGKEAYCRDR
jgi:hypothetical protein